MQIQKETSHEIETDKHFHLSLILMLKNPVFFHVLSWNYNTNVLYVRIIVPWFHEHIFRSN